MMQFSGAARPIIAYDVAAAANVYHIDLAGVRAIMDVESKNRGFDNKRRPLILFEPHVFYRNLPEEKRSLAVKAGLAYPRWGSRAYPSGQDAQYARLARAIDIDEEAAFRAISMGMGQVLGENHELAGCASAVEMFDEAKESEANQLRHMLEFLKRKGAVPKINAHRWLAVATLYNGEGQAKKYAGWLKSAHDRWERILSKPRQDLNAQDLKDAGSKTVEAAETGKSVVVAASIAGPTAGAVLDAATQGLQPITQAVQTAQQAQTAWQWISENWQFLAVLGITVVFLVLCYIAYREFHKVIEERVQNARDGMNMRI